MVIAIKGGQSSSPTITVRKVSGGIGVELILPLNSAQIGSIELVKRTRARRAKLYYVREKSSRVLGKKLKEVAKTRGTKRPASVIIEKIEDTVIEKTDDSEITAA